MCWCKIGVPLKEMTGWYCRNWMLFLCCYDPKQWLLLQHSEHWGKPGQWCTESRSCALGESIMRSFSQLVKSAKWACKIEDQSVGFAQERPCDYNASMQLLSGIILFFWNYCICVSFCIKNKFDIWSFPSVVKTNLTRSLRQKLLMSGEWVLVMTFQADCVLET